MDTPEVRGRPAGGPAPELDRGGRDHRLRRGGPASATATRACPAPRPTRAPRPSPPPRSDEAVGRLVAVIRRDRPQVDGHLPRGAARVPAPRPPAGARDLAWRPSTRRGTPTGTPRPGRPCAPAKLYYTVWPRKRMWAMHEKFLELGLESPFDEQLAGPHAARASRSRTSVDLAGFADVRGEALRAHATQVDPDVAVLVRAAARGPAHDPPVRRLPPGPQPGGGAGRGVIADRRRRRRSAAERQPGALGAPASGWTMPLRRQRRAAPARRRLARSAGAPGRRSGR